MKSSIVHIGYHKTATTWFQKRYYPHVAGYRYLSRDLVQAAFLARPQLYFDPLATRQRLGLSDGVAVILCEEELSGSIHNGGLFGYLTAEMPLRIKAVLPDARIAIFIRSQPDMIAATYLQYVRSGGTHRPRRYLFPPRYEGLATFDHHRNPRFCFEHFEYDRVVKRYDEVFGQKNVHVFVYEDFATAPEPFLADQATRLGFDRPEVSPGGKRVNRSYSAGLVPVVRFLNHFTDRNVSDKTTWLHIPHWYAHRRKLFEKLNKTGLFGAPPTAEQALGAEIVQWIRAYYAPSNRRLLALRALPLEAYDYPLRFGELPPAPTTRRAHWWSQ